MNYQLANEIYNSILSAKEEKLKLSIFRKAIDYAQMRAEWILSDREKRIEMDTPRRYAHNALIDSINILARNMKQNNEKTEWYNHLKDNRLAIGEFACFVHCFLGLKA